jgi:hypothetical protein
MVTAWNDQIIGQIFSWTFRASTAAATQRGGLHRVLDERYLCVHGDQYSIGLMQDGSIKIICIQFRAAENEKALCNNSKAKCPKRSD